MGIDKEDAIEGGVDSHGFLLIAARGEAKPDIVQCMVAFCRLDIVPDPDCKALPISYNSCPPVCRICEILSVTT
jgi:hypothetical protein